MKETDGKGPGGGGRTGTAALEQHSRNKAPISPQNQLPDLCQHVHWRDRASRAKTGSHKCPLNQGTGESNEEEPTR